MLVMHFLFADQPGARRYPAGCLPGPPNRRSSIRYPAKVAFSRLHPVRWADPPHRKTGRNISRIRRLLPPSALLLAGRTQYRDPRLVDDSAASSTLLELHAIAATGTVEPAPERPARRRYGPGRPARVALASVQVAAAVRTEAVRSTMGRNPYPPARPKAEIAGDRITPCSAPSGHLDDIAVMAIEPRCERGRLRRADDDSNTKGASQRKSS